jgi:hypothetical protein
MSDLLSNARGLRRKLHGLEVLLEIERTKPSREWFEGKAPEDPERKAAVERLSRSGLIEAAPPPEHFRLTPDGRDFLKDVRSKVGAHGALDWTHTDEIDFSRL